jgi:pyroglutamyl-peptidase
MVVIPMKKVLVTGFAPFDGEHINPSYEAIKSIDPKTLPCKLMIMEVPTEFYTSAKHVIDAMHAFDPDVIILIGQAGGRKEISVERIAINIDDASIPDNRGIQPIDHEISVFGQSAYFSTLPIKKLVKTLQDHGFPSSVSNSAGTYVCNHLMYSVLHELAMNQSLHAIAGFIHVPYTTEQVKDKPHVFALELETIRKAIELIIFTSIQ